MGGQGMNIVKSVPKSEHDPGVVLSATCDLCHAKHDRIPAKRPVCSNCGQDGCPECSELEMDQCDQCLAYVCRDCWIGWNGAKLCKNPACKDKAIADQVRAVEEERQRQAAKRPQGLRRIA
jgi:hypothetical protein